MDQAVQVLTQAYRADPTNAEVLIELGLAYQASDRPDAARHVFGLAVEVSPDDAIPRLFLAHALEVDERPELALLHNFRALAHAQQTRQRLDTDPGIGALAAHAQRFVQTHRRGWFDRALSGLREKNPGARWDRVDAAMAIYLRERAMPALDPRQRAGFMFVPGLDSTPFVDSARFDWPLDSAIATLTPLREEIAECCAGANALIVFQRGIAHFEARTKAPRLLAALGALPLARVPNHGPDCEILTLPPAARRPLQFGQTNSRVRIGVHLAGAPLQIAAGGQTRLLETGKPLAFDTSFGVEYANDGAAPARAIVFDVWHPDLSAAEREAIGALIAAAVVFDTRVMELS